MNTRIFLAIAAILAGLSVAAGAFASHALKDSISEKALAIFETGVKYQMYHALALLAIALLFNTKEISAVFLTITAYAFIIGILLFSGSLYVLSLSGLKWVGIITPIGGITWLFGWICLAISPWAGKINH
jgi:uncharacterized membrane protein YgdD (TMEM256/DUF423 family)